MQCVTERIIFEKFFSQNQRIEWQILDSLQAKRKESERKEKKNGINLPFVSVEFDCRCDEETLCC